MKWVMRDQHIQEDDYLYEFQTCFFKAYPDA